MEYQIEHIVDTIIAREPPQRPEIDWLQQKVSRLAEAEGLSGRLEADRLIFERMYARVPQKSEAMKLRYWRTGRHLPARRDEIQLYAQALDLTPEETLFFLQSCLAKSDRIFTREHLTDPACLSRRGRMEEMIFEYVDQVPPARMLQLDIPYSRLGGHVRHLYCLDALSTISHPSREGRTKKIEDHGSSSPYESEFLRQRELFGEIPRQTMLRHIILFSMPCLNRRIVDDRLRELGYLPLTEGHTTVRGALLDDLLLEVLDLYQKTCFGRDPLACRRWLLDLFRHVDQYLTDLRRDSYQFLYFRMLSNLV